MGDCCSRSANREPQSGRVYNDYLKTQVLGVGAFGEVWLVLKQNEEKTFAMKVITRARIKDCMQTILTERDIMRDVNSPFIVKLHDSFQSKSKFFLVMDYIPGGSLDDFLKQNEKVPRIISKFILAEILIGIRHLHMNQILHRDLKPANILIDKDGHIKLTDFGVSRMNFKSTDSAITFTGSPDYMAPEILKKEPYSYPADFWSYGKIAYELIIRDVQYQGRPETQDLDEVGHELIERLLREDPDTRCQSFDEIISTQYFDGISWDDIENKRIRPPYVPQVKPRTPSQTSSASEVTQTASYYPGIDLNHPSLDSTNRPY